MGPGCGVVVAVVAEAPVQAVGAAVPELDGSRNEPITGPLIGPGDRATCVELSAVASTAAYGSRTSCATAPASQLRISEYGSCGGVSNSGSTRPGFPLRVCSCVVTSVVSFDRSWMCRPCGP